MTNAKECFTYHVVLHGLFGLGLGILLSTLLSGLQNVWIGVGIMVVVVFFDMMRGGKKPSATPPTVPST